MKAIILAAGRGERLSPLTRILPKPLMPVLNEPLVGHALIQLRAVGVTHAFLNLHYGAQSIQRYLAGNALALPTTCRVEERLSGPAGGAALFLDQVRNEELVLVVSGDAFHDIPLDELVRAHRARGALLTVVTKSVQNPGRFGVAELADDGRVLGFVEKPALSPDSRAEVSCGIYCLSPRCLERVPRDRDYDFGRHLIPQLAESGQAVYAHRTSAAWEDVGTPEQLLRVNLAALTTPRSLAARGRQVSPGVFLGKGAEIQPTARLVPPLVIGERARIGDDCELIGPCVVGDGAVVDDRAVVTRSLLLPRSRVSRDSVVADCIIGSLEAASATAGEALDHLTAIGKP